MPDQTVDLQITPGAKLTMTISVDRASAPPGVHATGVQALSDTVARNADAHKRVRDELDVIATTQEELVDDLTRLEAQVAKLREVLASVLLFVPMPAETRNKLLEVCR